MAAQAAPGRASRVRKQVRARPSVGLALAGGGPLGGIYEVGVLLALADSLDGIDFNDLDVYVGVSSGSFVAAALANGVSVMVPPFIKAGDAIRIDLANRRYMDRAKPQNK